MSNSQRLLQEIKSEILKVRNPMNISQTSLNNNEGKRDHELSVDLNPSYMKSSLKNNQKENILPENMLEDFKLLSMINPQLSTNDQSNYESKSTRQYQHMLKGT